jgi:hypothetical protein
MGHASENAERPILNVEGNLVALGPLRRDLLALYQRWINDLGTMRTLGLAPLPMTREKKQDWYDRQSKAESDVPFTIYERETLRPPDRAVLRRWPTSSRGLCGNRPAHAAAVDMLASQPPVDGVLSYLPSGPVSEADVLRLYPWPDATVAGEMEAEELRKVAHAPWPWLWSVWGFDAPDPLGRGTATLAVLEGDAVAHVERALGRRVEWRRTGVGLREAVGRALS